VQCSGGTCCLHLQGRRITVCLFVTDREVKWLQIMLDKFLSPLNKSYFMKLWTKFGRDWASTPHNMIIFLLEVMQDDDFSDDSNRKAMELFETVENKEYYSLFPFSKVSAFLIDFFPRSV
jgi:hypothetical protein